MHEMALAESVIQIIEDAARTQRFTKVKKVRLEIGRLSGIEPESLRFCFDVIAKETRSDQAQLEILEVPGEGYCDACGKNVPLTERFDSCPGCGGFPLKVTRGTEMRVHDLEVE